MTQRQCSPCKVCCEGWLTAKINGQLIMPGKPCMHMTDQGCGIYEKRPVKPCATFNCGWLLDPVNLAEDMRPDLCGAIVIIDRKWQGASVIRAIPTGEKIPRDTLERLMTISREQAKPLIFCEFIRGKDGFIGIKRIGYGPPSFVRAVETAVEPEDVFKL